MAKSFIGNSNIQGALVAPATLDSTEAIETDERKAADKNREDAAGDMVFLSCSLQNSLRFDDIDNGMGGKQSVLLPGVNEHLRGLTGSDSAGILLDGGHAVCVRIPRAAWNSILQQHGSAAVFTHNPPFIREIKDEKTFRSKSFQSEIKELRTGLEPVDPAEARGITKAN